MTSGFVSRVLGVTAFALLWSIHIAAQDIVQNPMDCIEEMAMPSVSPGMELEAPTTIEIHILIGKNGRAQKVDFGDGNATFGVELHKNFREQTRYVGECEGKTLDFVFRYLLEGPPTDQEQPPVSEMRFRSPNEFIVRIHPVSIALDPMRPGTPIDYCPFSIRIIDSDLNPINDLSISLQPIAKLMTYRYGYLTVMVNAGEDVLLTGFAPEYEPVKVNLPCPKPQFVGETPKKVVVMIKKK